jgi:hypothetical protein
MLYCNPPTLLETMLESARKIEELRGDPAATPLTVLDAWEARLSLLMGKLVAAPTCTSFCLWGERDPCP